MVTFVDFLSLIIGSLSILSLASIATSSSSLISIKNLTVPSFVTKHAPLVWLHSDDPFKPSDLLRHIRKTTPRLDGRPLPGIPQPLDLENLATVNELGDQYQIYLTSNDDATLLPEWLFGESPDSSGRIENAVPCVVILIEKNAREVDAFYFYFYSYNRGANISQVVEPLDSLLDDTGVSMHFGDHIGDWEHNMIRYIDGKPAGIYYSEHSDGAAYAWGNPKLSKYNDRPFVYSAYGSHANYVSEGNHVHNAALVDYCDAGYQWDPILSAYFYHLDPSNSTLTPIFYEQSSAPFPYPTSFFHFTGKWGDRQYDDDDPRQETVKYFNLKRFESGPTGPYAKSLVRKGLYPDQRHIMGWTEWGVSVFMSLYPHLFKGWRVWVSLTVFISSFVFIGFAIKYAFTKYSRRGYKTVETEIPLTDFERYD